MAMAIDEAPVQFPFSSYSLITSSSSQESCDWSPYVDWNFQDLVLEPTIPHGVSTPTEQNSKPPPSVIEPSNESNGVRLVHLLMAAAEAIGGPKPSRDLAEVILIRVRELVPSTKANGGSTTERLAVHFTSAFQTLLEHGETPRKRISVSTHDETNVVAAFQLLQTISPFVKFGYFTANQAILEAMTYDRKIHIIDYDIMEGVQWASLMQALISMKNGPPSPHLRVTAIVRSGSGSGSGADRRSFGSVQDTGRRLTAFASSLGLQFSFHKCKLDPNEIFNPSSLKLFKGEAVAVNCMLHLPHFNSRSFVSVRSFLDGAKTLNPRVITLSEEEIGSVTGCGFTKCLLHFSALFDSIQEGFGFSSGRGPSMELVEQVLLGPRIVTTMTRLYSEKIENGSLAEWLLGEGYKPIELSFSNHCQAKLLIGLFNYGYRTEELAKNRLALVWKSRQLLSTSIWTSPEYPFSS